MSELLSPRPHHAGGHPLALLGRLMLLNIPALVLLVGCLRDPNDNNLILWIGVGFQTALCLFLTITRQAWSRSLAPSIIVVFLTALTWVWFGDTREDWFNHLAKAVLIVIPLV